MNFYQEEPQFRALLKELLDSEFFEYADTELQAFGEKCANEIDERARFTDREGQPKKRGYLDTGRDLRCEVFGSLLLMESVNCII